MRNMQQRTGLQMATYQQETAHNNSQRQANQQQHGQNQQTPQQQPPGHLVLEHIMETYAQVRMCPLTLLLKTARRLSLLRMCSPLNR
jgi:hypothetical protein